MILTGAQSGSAPAHRGSRNTGVVVIGAGLAGLTAARELVAAGRSVAVLEARDRVGGRLLDHDLGEGRVAELGGHFVGPEQDHILALAKEVGVETFQATVPGEAVYVHDGWARRFSSDLPPELLVLPDLDPALARIGTAAREMDPVAPWKAPGATELDGTTFEAWLREAGITGDTADMILLWRLPFGTLITCAAVYDEPFWRKDELSGVGLLRDGSPIREMFDNSSPDGGSGVLMGFIGGRRWGTWAKRPARERRSAVLRCFAQVVGDRAFDVRDYVEQDWTAERWTQGGPTSIAAPGVISGYGEWSGRPFGRVYWAGSEFSPHWNGFMDGAVRSGQHAAADLLHQD